MTRQGQKLRSANLHLLNEISFISILIHLVAFLLTSDDALSPKPSDRSTPSNMKISDGARINHSNQSAPSVRDNYVTVLTRVYKYFQPSIYKTSLDSSDSTTDIDAATTKKKRSIAMSNSQKYL